MTFQVLSNLHTDISLVDTIPVALRARMLIIPGDVGSWVTDQERFKVAITRCATAVERVIFVPGNHEYYGGDFDRTEREMREWMGTMPNVHYLNCDTLYLPGLVIIGCTLWQNIKNDSPCIDSVAIRLGGRVWSREENNILHTQQLEWLDRTLREVTAARAWDNRAATIRKRLGVISEALGDYAADCISEAGCPLADASIIVVTHFPPHERFDRAADASDLVQCANFWIFSDRQHVSQFVGSTLCLANPIGMPWEQTDYRDTLHLI